MFNFNQTDDMRDAPFQIIFVDFLMKKIEIIPYDFGSIEEPKIILEI